MKKILSGIFSVLFLLILIGEFQITVYANEITIKNETKASKLKTLGLFMGTESGFELEKKLSRVEGAVMLVRILGKESEAVSENYQHPFDDVPEWANSYIGYLFQNKIVNGTTPKEFGSNDDMSAKQYLTLVLRALGYNDALGDFQLDNSVDKASEIKLIDNEQNIALKKENDFLRDDVVGISYNALETPIKDTGKKLYEKLIEAGIFKKESIETILFNLIEVEQVVDGVTIIYSNGTNEIKIDRELLPDGVKNFERITVNASNMCFRTGFVAYHIQKFITNKGVSFPYDDEKGLKVQGAHSANDNRLITFIAENDRVVGFYVKNSDGSNVEDIDTQRHVRIPVNSRIENGRIILTINEAKLNVQKLNAGISIELKNISGKASYTVFLDNNCLTKDVSNYKISLRNSNNISEYTNGGISYYESGRFREYDTKNGIGSSLNTNFPYILILIAEDTENPEGFIPVYYYEVKYDSAEGRFIEL